MQAALHDSCDGNSISKSRLGAQGKITLVEGQIYITAEPLRRLTSLRRLSLQSNRLASMTGFEHCIHLEELYLSHNGISKLEVR